MIKAVIFDCFGVLAGKSYKRIYFDAGGDLEKDDSFLEEALYASNSGQISNIELNKRVAQKIGMTADNWHKIVLDNELPNEELFTYIQQLKKKYKIAALSNAFHGTLERKFTKEQLAMFDAKVVSAEVGMIKPNKEIYLHAAELLEVKPEECIFIDDKEDYAQASEQVGMKWIHYKSFEQMKAELEKILAADSNR